MPTGLMKNELKLVSKPQIEIILTLLTKGLHPLSFVERGSWLCSDNLSGIETPCSKLQRMFCLAAVLRSDCKEFYQFFDSLAVAVQIYIFIQRLRIFESVPFPKKGKFSLEKML